MTAVPVLPLPEDHEAERRRTALLIADRYADAPDRDDLLEMLGLKGYTGRDTERVSSGRSHPVWRPGLPPPREWT